VDIERALISKIIRSGQLHDAVSNGVREDLFADPEMQDMFLFIQAHFRKYGEPPSIQAVQDQKPKFEFEHTQDPLDYLVDRFKINATIKKDAMSRGLLCYPFGGTVDGQIGRAHV